MRMILSALFVFVFATSVSAATFTLVHDGKALSGGDVCLFEAGAPDDPVRRLTTFSSVTCSAADGSVALPAGTWNLFARHGDGLVSDVVLVKDGRVEGDLRELRMRAASSLSVAATMTDTDRFALYVEDRGTVIPLVPGEDSVLAPLGSRVFPLFLRRGAITSIGEGRKVEEGALPPVTRVEPRAGVRDLAVGLVPDRAAFDALASEERLPGTIALSGTGIEAAMTPVDDVTTAFDARPILALFRGVPRAEDLTAAVVGNGWTDTAIDVPADVAPQPLTVAPATSLAVRWSLASDVPDLVKEFGSRPPCESQEREPPRPYPPGTPTEGRSVSLWRCPGMTRDYNLRYVYIQRCELVTAAELTSDAFFGETALEGVSTGLYLLRLAHEPLPATFRLVEIDRPSQVADIDLAFDRWFGTVTHGGEPIRAAVDLGWGGVSDADTGEYTSIRAVLPAPERPAPPRPKGFAAAIWVEGCTEEIGYAYLPDETPPPNSRVDIDIPLNELRVVARSAETGEPVTGAGVSMSAMLPAAEGVEPGIHFGGEWGKTNTQGRFSIHNVPPNRRLHVCAVHEQYERQCAEEVALNDDREREVTLLLTSANVRRGRVNRQSIERGQVVWYGPDGAMKEVVDVAGDGSFTYKQEHPAGELLFVIAADAPLLATRQPGLPDGAELTIDYPDAPVRSFEVALATGASPDQGFITIAIGDIVVPGNVFFWHGSRRVARNIGRVSTTPGPVPDILATGLIAFVFATDVWAQTNWPRDGRDLFYAPAAVSLPRTPAGDSPRIVLGGTGSNLRLAAVDAEKREDTK